MDFRRVAALLAIAACFLGGCSLLEPVGPGFLGEGGGAPPPAADAPQAGDAEIAAGELDGVEGDVVPIPRNYITSPSPAAGQDPIYLQAVVDLGDVMVLQWSVSNGKRGPTLLEGISTATGESLWRDEAAGYAYNTLPGESAGEFLVLYEDRVEYGSGSTGERQPLTLPAPVLEALPTDNLVAAPYDILRGAGVIAYCGGDGVYVCDLDGGNARLAMPHSYLPSRLNYLGMDRMLEDYDADRMCYVAPQLMGGGGRLAATSYLRSGGGAASRPVNVMAVNLDTGAVLEYPDLLNPGALPACRLNDDTLLAVGEDRFLRMSVSAAGGVEDVPFADADMLRDASWDYRLFGRCAPEGDGYVFSTYSAPDVAARRTLVTVAGWQGAGIWHMTERALVCHVTDDDLNVRLFLVPYGS